MKIDLYTKSILTIIAFALVVLSLQNFTSDADAKYQASDIVGICALNSEKCVAHYDSGEEGVSFLGVIDSYAFQQLKVINTQLKVIVTNIEEMNDKMKSSK